MALTTGTRLGPYEIVAALGAGGMGEVYRARDTRLDRDVAIKVLPPAFTEDVGRRERFEREAKAIAALSHPNIVAIFDTGQAPASGHQTSSGGALLPTLYVVTELLEGGTLRDALGTGALPVKKAVDVAVQVARGLAAAHEKGLVHRDLKPENVFLVADGRAKILDFGLARHTLAGSGATETAAAITDPGTVLGTVGYMAPEQVRGLAVDARADLFALGTVLYEMLSGRRAFKGETSADTMFAIVKEEPPDMLASRASLSPSLDRIVRHCLEKNPSERFQSARDVAFALEALSGSSTSASAVQLAAEVVDTPRLGWRGIRALAAPPVAVAGLVMIAGAFALGSWWSAPRRHWPTEWIGQDLGGPPAAFQPRVSPNGQSLAFQTFENNQAQVAVMNPDSGSWQVLTSDRTSGAANTIAWSSDGGAILFSRTLESPRGIFSVPVPSGDTSVILRDASAPQALPDGDLLVTRINADREPQLYRYRQGQEPEPIDAILASALSVYRVFPDGREAVFFGHPKTGKSVANHLYAVELAAGRAPRMLAPGVNFPAETDTFTYDFPVAATPGWVLFDLKSGDLHQIAAAPRDGSARLEVLFSTTTGPSNIDVARDGTIYIDQPRLVRRGIGWIRTDTGSIEIEESSATDAAGFPLPLPNGDFLTTATTSGRTQLIIHVRGKTPQPFVPTLRDEETSGPLTMLGPDRVAFLGGASGRREIVIVSLADRLVVRRLKQVPASAVSSLAGSPADGATLYYAAAGSIWAIPSDESQPPRRIRAGDSVAVDPKGQYLVVKVDEKDGARLFRVPVTGGEGTEIKVAGGLRIVSYGPNGLMSNAVAADGRIVMRVAPADSWYWPAAVLDPRTGQLDIAIKGSNTDQWGVGWTADGRIITFVAGFQSRLWRFRAK